MSSFYAWIKPIYRRLIPHSLRAAIFSRRDSPLHRLVNFLKQLLERRASDAEIYDRDYFANVVGAAASSSAPAMCESLIREFAPSSMIDVGCGTGALMQQFIVRGVNCLGLENADAAIEILNEHGLPNRKVDLEGEAPTDLHADLVISAEVAEHLPAKFADNFVNLLCGISDNIAMTAATPGQGGTDHVNEQPHSYWVEKFSKRGFEFDERLSIFLRSEWESRGVADFYYRNVLVFRRARR